MAGITPCAITSLLANDFATALDSINRKLKALRRFAELLEQLSLANLLPNITSLVPVPTIDLQAYTNLVAACPFLNLPVVPNQIEITRLRDLVASAYKQLIAQLSSHPFSRMALLQAQMDKAVSRVSTILNQGDQYVRCCGFACGTNLPSFVAPIDTTGIGTQSRKLSSSGTTVLTPAQQKKADAVAQMISTLRRLLTTSSSFTPPTITTGAVVELPGPHPIPAPPEGGVI